MFAEPLFTTAWSLLLAITPAVAQDKPAAETGTPHITMSSDDGVARRGMMLQAQTGSPAGDCLVFGSAQLRTWPSEVPCSYFAPVLKTLADTTARLARPTCCEFPFSLRLPTCPPAEHPLVVQVFSSTQQPGILRCSDQPTEIENGSVRRIGKTNTISLMSSHWQPFSFYCESGSSLPVCQSPEYVWFSSNNPFLDACARQIAGCSAGSCDSGSAIATIQCEPVCAVKPFACQFTAATCPCKKTCCPGDKACCVKTQTISKCCCGEKCKCDGCKCPKSGEETEACEWVAESVPQRLLAFSAKWCKPCQKMQPVWQKLRAEGVPVMIVDIDANPALAQKHGINAVPTMVMIDNGFETGRLQGLQAATRLQRWVRDKVQQTSGQTLPSAHYLQDDVQYFPAGPETPLTEPQQAFHDDNNQVATDLPGATKIRRLVVAVYELPEQQALALEQFFDSPNEISISRTANGVEVLANEKQQRVIAHFIAEVLKAQPKFVPFGGVPTGVNPYGTPYGPPAGCPTNSGYAPAPGAACPAPGSPVPAASYATPYRQPTVAAPACPSLECPSPYQPLPAATAPNPYANSVPAPYVPGAAGSVPAYAPVLAPQATSSDSAAIPVYPTYPQATPVKKPNVTKPGKSKVMQTSAKHTDSARFDSVTVDCKRNQVSLSLDGGDRPARQFGVRLQDGRVKVITRENDGLTMNAEMSELKCQTEIGEFQLQMVADGDAIYVDLSTSKPVVEGVSIRATQARIICDKQGVHVRGSEKSGKNVTELRGQSFRMMLTHDGESGLEIDTEGDLLKAPHR